MSKNLTFIVGLFLATCGIVNAQNWSLDVIQEGFDLYYLIDSKEDLIWVTDTLNLDFDGNGTADFDSLGAKWNVNYRLMTDIEFNADSSLVDWNNDGVVDIANTADSLGLPPIGGYTDANGNAVEFTGFFDGNYYTIWNVYKRGTYRNAMVANMEGTRIENLRLMNYKVYTWEDYNAGIAGQANHETPVGDDNIIKRCWVEGKIIFTPNNGKTNLYTGGIIGRLEYGEVSECYTNMTIIGNLEGNRRISGIVGQMAGVTSIKDCYSVCDLTAFEQVGIIAARLAADPGAVLENCYAVGTVTGGDDPQVGAFAGDIQGLVPVSCYWDKEVGDTVGVGDGDEAAIAAVIGLNTADFAVESNFVGWDFTNTWEMGTVGDVTRPVLQWQSMVHPPVGIKPAASLSHISAYPNPVLDELYVNFDGSSVNYTLTNILGQLVETGILNANNSVIDLAGFEQGIYILNVENQGVVKIIKK